jgi:hypothetical protein
MRGRGSRKKERRAAGRSRDVRWNASELLSSKKKCGVRKCAAEQRPNAGKGLLLRTRRRPPRYRRSRSGDRKMHGDWKDRAVNNLLANG